MGYDDWLVAPYEAMCKESDRFYDWAENNDYDIEDEEDLKLAEEHYQDWLAEQDELYAEYMLDKLEDRYEDRYDLDYED